MTATVTDNPEKSRYELPTEAGPAVALYRLTPGTMVITYTEVPWPLRGRGVGAQLLHGAMQDIRARGLKVVAGCGYVAQLLAEHADAYADLRR
jgi:predicted GNAT family acetyltransferase